MTVTSNNVLGFKEYLKNNKEAFKSNIIPAYMGDISASLGGSFPVGTNALTPIKVILFDYNETVDIQNELLDGDYVYLPGTSNDKVRLQNGSAYTDFNFDANGDVTGQTVGNYYVVGGYRLELINVGGGLYQSSPAPSYTMTQSATSLNEGDTVTFTITTTNVQDGTLVNYSTTGTVNADDFTDGLLSGSININNNSGSFTRTIVNDYTVGEGAENFTITLSEGGSVVATSNQISVADTSIASYNVAGGSATVAEDSSVTFTVTTTGIPDGTNLYYTLNPAGEFNNDYGNFTINNNTGSVTVTADQDFFVENDETVTFQLRTSSINGPIVATTSVVVTDAPFSVTVTAASTSINEPLTGTANIVLNITTTGVNDGVVLTASIAAGSTASVYDVDGISSATVNNNAATFTIPVKRDGRTEGAETIQFEIQAGASVVATSPAITINDTSYVGLNHTGKTFGPININRDEGNTAIATDIYALCNLDQLADGSDIALFVDNSGSMTTSSIQAAYDSLIAQLNARNMSVIVVENPHEDWISDFDTTL
tara:strand:- start:147 stop:1772 length:1626 start_codon:yes stop_codon:yes gene_type:complete